MGGSGFSLCEVGLLCLCNRAPGVNTKSGCYVLSALCSELAVRHERGLYDGRQLAVVVSLSSRGRNGSAVTAGTGIKMERRSDALAAGKQDKNAPQQYYSAVVVP